MKHITGPILFLTTLALGIAIPSLRHAPTHSIVQPLIAPVAAPETPSMSPGVDQNDFKAEFRNLPDLGDNAYEPTTTKLVDVFEYGNEYFRSEAVAKTGEVWLGLFETKGEYQLKNTKISVRLSSRAKDADYEDSVRFSFGSKHQPLFLIKNAKTLNPSQVVTIYHRPSPDEITSRNLPLKELTLGYAEQFHQLGEIYKLRVAAGSTVDGTKLNVLVLETKDSHQILTYNLYYRDHNTLYNSIGELLWVGDLDGDNQLDLYLSDFGFEKGGFGSQNIPIVGAGVWKISEVGCQVRNFWLLKMLVTSFKFLSFFVSLLIGLLAVDFFILKDVEKVPLVVEVASSSSVSNLNKEFAPEFTEIEFDERTQHTSMQLEFVEKDSVWVCTAKPAEEEQNWLVLMNRSGRFSLEKRTVAYGNVSRSDFGRFSKMRFADSRSAVLMLAGQGTLRPAPVTTLFLKRPLNDDDTYVDGLERGRVREFSLDEKHYRLRVTAATLKSGQSIYALVLERGEETQIIWYKSSDYSNLIGELEWVGDMDGDRNLDLLISSYAQNGGQLERFLFLSSFAVERNLVGLAGFYSARCTS